MTVTQTKLYSHLLNAVIDIKDTELALLQADHGKVHVANTMASDDAQFCRSVYACLFPLAKEALDEPRRLRHAPTLI